MSNEQIYYDALKRISKEYMTTEQLQRRAEKEYGVSYHEALEMSYDNIQGCAADAIRGKRRPKDLRGQQEQLKAVSDRVESQARNEQTP